jgi:hypothetical protein
LTSTVTNPDRDWVLARLVEIVERAMAGEPVLARDGTPTGQMKYDGAVANRALELIGKLQGLFAERRAENHEDERTEDELRSELSQILSTLAELGVDLPAVAHARRQHGGAAAAAGED